MEAPKCKLCGEKHWSNQPCLTEQDWDEIQQSALEKLKPTADTAFVNTVSHAKYDRNAAHRAYMKEYMRKRRAKAKEAGK